MLRTLLARHPELLPEAEEIAEAVVSSVDVDAIAADVECAIHGVDLEDVYAHSGRTSGGYVEPGDAASELLEKALEPFLMDMRRRIDLGLEAAAVETCQGIVLGLYQCRDAHASEAAVKLAQEFPEETAAQALATLRAGSVARCGRAWRLPATFAQQIPEWGSLVKPARSRAGGRNR